MIEKWKDEEDFDNLENWCTKVELALEEYHTDRQITGYLSKDDFEDVLQVMVENSDLKITLYEELYDTTDMRENNIQVIKYFVEEELPYYVFAKETTPLDSDHAFTLIFKLKEGF